MTKAAGPNRRASASALAGCVRDLVRAAVDTGYLPMGPVEAEQLLRRLVVQLVDALHAEEFQTAPGYEIGEALVEADITSPEMVGRAVKVLAGRLLPDLGEDTPEQRARMPGLVGAVSTGYARALRDRTREDQEEMHRAMIVAQHIAGEAVRASEERRWWESRHDALTGLPNREQFLDRLGAIFALRRGGERIGVCLLGMDRFGGFTDSLGHDAAEELLVAVAHRLQDRFGADGHLVARLGRDEFAILAAGLTDPDDVDKLADAAFATLGAPFVLGRHRLHVSASAGVVERLVSETNATEVVRSAQVSLRWAKADGGGRWRRFDPQRHDRDMARWALGAALPAALERHEFVVEYQPIRSLADRQLRGVEALVRWQHPERGLLGPDTFVGLAEETGLIVPLGRWVLHEACWQAQRWSGLGPTAPFVSVNLAVHQARSPGLVDDVQRVLADTGLDPARLQLEVTESALVGPGEPLAALRRVDALGVRVAIDDFGTGYANYAHLRTLPVRGIKLAAEFVNGLEPADPPNQADREVVGGLVSLAHALGLAVTAEGVETARQATLLAELGCDSGQGWHLGRPVCPSDVAALLAG